MEFFCLLTGEDEGGRRAEEAEERCRFVAAEGGWRHLFGVPISDWGGSFSDLGNSDRGDWRERERDLDLRTRVLSLGNDDSVVPLALKFLWGLLMDEVGVTDKMENVVIGFLMGF